MKKKILSMLMLLAALFIFCSCELLPDSVKGLFDQESNNVAHEHVWTSATCLLPKICECGETNGEPLGHNATEPTCTAASVCDRCGLELSEATGHDMSDATCEEKAICKTCGATEGPALGHDMTEATCNAPSFCKVCGKTDELPVSHNLLFKYTDSEFTYYCEYCNKNLSLENYYYLSAEGYDGMDWNATNAKNFITVDPSGRPMIENGHYELINNTGELGQMQIWVPAMTPVMDGFSKEAEAVGMLSFRLDALVTNNFNMKLCDTSSVADRWSEEWCITSPIFEIMPAQKVNESTVVYIYGCDKLLLGEIITNGYDGFTGWLDVKIGIILDSRDSTVTLHYYLDGDYKGWVTKPLTTSTGAINSVYINGNTAAMGSGIRLDDVVFGYSPYGSWELDTHVHELLEGSCVGVVGCNVCKAEISGGDLFGHKGGVGSCSDLPICDVCGETYGSFRHDMSEVSCKAPPTCSLCGFSEGEKAAHTLTHAYSDSHLTYSCVVCQKSFTVKNGAYLDGSGYENMVGILNKDNFTTSGGTQLPVIEDGVFKLINTSGKDAQLQLWIPSNNTEGAGVTEGFVSRSYPAGFISFRFNSYMTGKNVLRMQFVDHSTGADRWSEEWCIKDQFFKVTSVTSADQTTVDIFGIENTLIGSVTIDPETGFTGWIDVKIGLVLDPITDQVVLHYYLDGEYKATRSTSLTTSSNGINSVYVTGSTDVIGSGVMLDEIAFGYTPMATWVFDNCEHDWRSATCTEAKKCTRCYKTVGNPLGHSGGSATCTELATCTRCKKTYGEYAPHDLSDDGVCVECGNKTE